MSGNEAPQLTADLPVAEAGRVMMARELATIDAREPAVRMHADVIGVHEMRKAIRRTFTGFRLFAPYFVPKAFKKHRRSLRKVMTPLGRSRDLAVCRQKLDAYNLNSPDPLVSLAQAWTEEQGLADVTLRQYLQERQHKGFLEDFRRFLASPGQGVEEQDAGSPLLTIAHVAPVLAFQRVGAVRAFEGLLSQARVEELHPLRIQFKELRYTLEFLAPLMGPEINGVLVQLKEAQDHLGDLNDTAIAMRLLKRAPGPQAEVECYRRAVLEEQERLASSFWPVWEAFDTPAWRRELAQAAAVV